MRAWLAVMGMAALACNDAGAGALPGDADAGGQPDAVAAHGVEHTQATPILGADGTVVARGWARRPLFVFERAAVPAALSERIREWDFYAVHAPGLALMVTLAEVRLSGRGHVVLASASLHDFAAQAAHEGSLLLPDAGEVLDLLPTAGGNYRVAGAGGWLEYADGPAGRRIAFALAAAGGGEVRGEVTLTLPPDESVALVTPFSEAGQFFYENKVSAMPARGFVEAGGRRYELGEAFAVMDWVRAVAPAVLDWTWAIGVGMVDGRRVGLNFGSVFGDESAGTPDAVVVDGVLHKLPPVTWDESDASGGWRLSSADGRVELRLVPNGYRERQDLDLGFYKTTLDKPYGVWSGSVGLDDGSRLQVDGLLGAAERVHTEW